MRKFLLFIWILLGFVGSPLLKAQGQIGTGTGTTSTLPIYGTFGYSYSQQLYTAAELTTALGTNTTISKIRFKVTTAPGTLTSVNAWTVYMGNTNKTTYASNTDWVPLTGMTQVYTGLIPNMTAGTWVEITLATPFTWNGTDNLVIAVDENSSGWSSVTWQGFTAAPTFRGIYHYSDTVNADPAAPPAASSRVSIIPQIQLVPSIACTAAAPQGVTATNVTGTSAQLNWLPATGATYVLQYRQLPSGTWQTLTATGASYNLTGLLETTPYEFRIAYVCNGVQGAFTTVQFTTTTLTYCPSSSSNFASEWISNVTVTPTGTATMSNTSAGSTYTDYSNNTAAQISLIRGTNATLSVSKGFSGSTYSETVTAYIDFNRNGVFETSEQIMASPASTTTPVTSSFTVPATAYSGTLPVKMRVQLKWNSTPGPCDVAYGDGEVEDYQVKFIDPIPCTSAAPTNTTNGTLTATTATVSWMPATGATYILQYRPVGATTWITVTPAPTTSTYTFTNLLEATSYEWRVAYVCGTTTGTYSTPVTFTTPALQYCTSTATSTSIYEYISNVTATPVGTPQMSNSSMPGPLYSDYSANPSKLITVIRGTAGNTISITKAFPSSTWSCSVGVWVDWNRDGVFNNTTGSNEIIVVSPVNTNTNVTATFTVPAAAYSGANNVKMRIVILESGTPVPCGSYTYGETEDYAVKIIDPVPCTSAAPTSLTAVTTNNSAILSWMPAVNATYQLEYREQGTTAWTVVTPNLTVSNYTITGLPEQKTYEWRVRYICASGTQSAYATSTFTTKPLPYCDIAVTNPNPQTEWMSNVTVTPAGNIAPMSNNSGASNYSDYYLDTTKLVTLGVDTTNNLISIAKSWSGTPADEAIAVYIDFNRNGTFETSEKVVTSAASQTTPLVASFNIPATVTPTALPTRMRVMLKKTSAPTDACTAYSNGEVEDYAVKFVVCNNAQPQNVTVTAITATSATVSWTADPGGAIYQVRYRPVGTTTWSTVNVTTNTANLVTLQPYTQYQVEVLALCKNTPGAAGTAIFTTPCSTAAPTLTVGAVTSSTAALTWTASFGVTYTVRYRPVGTTTWLPAAGLVVSTNSTTLTGLLPGTTYEVQVANICNGVTGAYSSIKVFITDRTCDMAPSGLTVTNITNNSAVANWNAFPGATYVLRWHKVGAAQWDNVTLTTNTYTFTNLQDLTQYELQVANVCSGTQGNWTPAYLFTTTVVQYCPMVGANFNSEYISNVKVKNAAGTEMSNDSNGAAYTNYTGQPTKIITLMQGTANNNITVTKKWATTQYNDAVTAWIDFNRNGKFEDSEKILNSPANQQTPVSATFNVPLEAFVSLTNGQYTTMRVALSRDVSPVTCTNIVNGEVEDYQVVIMKQPVVNALDKTQILLYPNPTHNTLYVTKVKDGATYKVYTSAGQLVKSGNIVSNKIDVSGLIQGIYLLDIDNDGETAQLKFIKE